MIRARSTRLIGSVRDREISSKRRRCSASVGSAITRRGATIGSPNPIPARLLPHLVQNAESRPNILIYRNLYTSILRPALLVNGQSRKALPPYGDPGFESFSLHRRVGCDPDSPS